jgi:hypothetical protein
MIMLLRTIRANTVTEFSIRMLLDISLQFIPISFIIPYFFAGSAYGQKAAQGLNFC